MKNILSSFLHHEVHPAPQIQIVELSTTTLTSSVNTGETTSDLYQFSFEKIASEESKNFTSTTAHPDDSQSVFKSFNHHGFYYGLHLKFKGQSPLLSDIMIIQKMMKLDQDDVILQEGEKISFAFEIDNKPIDVYLGNYKHLDNVSEFLNDYAVSSKARSAVIWKPEIENPTQVLLGTDKNGGVFTLKR